MNEMMKKIRQNSLKSKTPYNEPKSPDQYKKFAEKKSLQLYSDIPTPKKNFPNNFNTKNGFSTTTNENASKIIPAFPKDKQNEKSIERKQKIMTSLSKINITNKKSLSHSKEKDMISNSTNTSAIISNEAKSKSKINLQVLEEYEKNNYQSEIVKTPNKMQKTKFSSNFTTPKNTTANSNVSTRNIFATAETDQAKVLNILNGHNNIPISINNLKLYSNQNFQTAKYSSKSLSYVRGYSANTNQGIIR